MRFSILGVRKSAAAAATVAIFVLAALLFALVPQSSVAATSADDLTGIYLGQQDDSRFLLRLRQDGSLLRGTIFEGAGVPSAESALDSDALSLLPDGDPIIGFVNGSAVVWLRQSQPVEVWVGEQATAHLVGRWFGPAGSGAWKAAPIDVAALLVIHKRVAPQTIPAGQTSDLEYGITIQTRGPRPARNVLLRDAHFPDFYQIHSIVIRRHDPAEAGDPAGAVDIGAAAALTGITGLSLGDIPPGGAVTVLISGTARPSEAGIYRNVATASADNARRVSTHAVLTVRERCRDISLEATRDSAPTTDADRTLRTVTDRVAPTVRCLDVVR